MDLNVNIDPKTIEQYLVDAILKSSIGDAVKESVNRVLKNCQQSYNNPIDAVINQHIGNMVREVLHENHREEIKEAVTKGLAAKLTDDFIQRVVEQAASRYS